MNKLFWKGIKDGVPIALGYLSVAFGFGILSVSMGLSVLQAVGISASNLTSAGQVAGVEIIAAGGTLIEIILTQIVINIRYSLMGISLSQKLDPSFGTLQRLIVSFGITDEIFAVSYAQKGKIKPIYMYGLIIIAFLGWTLGTLFGAAAGLLFLGLLHLLVRPVLYPLFDLSSEAAAICTMMLTVSFLGMSLQSFCTTNIVGVLRGGGDVKVAAIVDILPLWVIALPLAALFGLVLKWGILFVCLARLSESAIKCLAGHLRYRTGKWIRDVTRGTADSL